MVSYIESVLLNNLLSYYIMLLCKYYGYDFPGGVDPEGSLGGVTKVLRETAGDFFASTEIPAGCPGIGRGGTGEV